MLRAVGRCVATNGRGRSAGFEGVGGPVALRTGMREEPTMFALDRARPRACSPRARGGGGTRFRAAAAGVVLVLAAAAAPDGSRVLAQQGGGDLRFAVPVRDGGAPGSPVLARLGPFSAVRSSGYHTIPAANASFTVYSGVTGIQVELFDNGITWLFPSPVPGAAVRQRMENELVVLVTRLNSAGDGLFSQSQDTFVLEPLTWSSMGWVSAVDASRATRIAAALGSAGDRSQWHLIAVDRTVPGVDVDETAQRFLYVTVPSEPPPPSPPSRVTGVRVSPLDGGLRVSWSAAAGEVSQYRVDAADASGKLARRVYTDAGVHEAVVDRLVNGVEYTVTVTALTSHPGVEGPASETATATPRVGGDAGDVPVPALPLAGAGVLAGLLASAAYRLRRAGRRAHPGRRRRSG